MITIQDQERNVLYGYLETVLFILNHTLKGGNGAGRWPARI
jgi:hypothetical protein